MERNDIKLAVNRHEQPSEFTRYLCNPSKQMSEQATGQHWKKFKEATAVYQQRRPLHPKHKKQTKYSN
jgi:hypothetical protein